METKQPVCIRCSGTLRDGKIVSGVIGAGFPARWVPAVPPKPGFLDLVRPDGGLDVVARRCDACGLVEFYAPPPV